MPTTTEPMTVSATVMEQYNRVSNGEKAAAVAKDLGITGSTVSANVKRVREALEAGRTVSVDGGEPTTGTGSAAPTVDIHAIAETMVPGASLVTRALDTIERERDDADKRADALVKRATEQADTLRANARKLVDERTPQLTAVASALGFDIDAWRERIAAEPAPTEPAPTEPAPTEPAPTA